MEESGSSVSNVHAPGKINSVCPSKHTDFGGSATMDHRTLVIKKLSLALTGNLAVNGMPGVYWKKTTKGGILHGISSLLTSSTDQKASLAIRTPRADPCMMIAIRLMGCGFL